MGSEGQEVREAGAGADEGDSPSVGEALRRFRACRGGGGAVVAFWRRGEEDVVSVGVVQGGRLAVMCLEDDGGARGG